MAREPGRGSVDGPTIRRSRPFLLALVLLLGVAVYAGTSYVVVPELWRLHERHHPALDAVPLRAVTRQGIPGDPINLSLVATEEEVQRSMSRAGWMAADATTLRSALRIAADVVARRPYALAPVSDLYVWGRRQDLAFERPVGHDPRRRHHVRLWRSGEVDSAARPLWAGAATFDTGVGVSRLTGQITHHISPDVDLERDELVADLQRAEDVDVRWIDGFQRELTSRNAGGDPYSTDGRLAVVRWKPRSADGGR